MPYDPALRTPQGDIESRMGLQPLEELHAERDELVKQVSELRARHAAGGTWDALRKIALSTAAMQVRAKAVAEGIKLTEAAIDDMSHTIAEYVEFVTVSTLDRAKWAELENRIQSINERINRGQVLGRFLTNELTLER